MFVIVLLSLFHVTDDEPSLLSEDCQDLLQGPLEEMDMWMNDEELFGQLQESLGKNTSEKPQQLSAYVSKAWGKMPPRRKKSLRPEMFI
jgi:hypothetical protein